MAAVRSQAVPEDPTAEEEGGVCPKARPLFSENLRVAEDFRAL